MFKNLCLELSTHIWFGHYYLLIYCFSVLMSKNLYLVLSTWLDYLWYSSVGYYGLWNMDCAFLKQGCEESSNLSSEIHINNSIHSHIQSLYLILKYKKKKKAKPHNWSTSVLLPCNLTDQYLFFVKEMTDFICFSLLSLSRIDPVLIPTFQSDENHIPSINFNFPKKVFPLTFSSRIFC